MDNYNFEKDKFSMIIPEIQTAHSLEKFLKENATKLSNYEWFLISKNKVFSLSIIPDEYLDLLDWEYICSTISLTEDELRKYHDYLNWYCVSCFQKLSKEFILEYKDFLSLDKLLTNDLLDRDALNYARSIYEENNNDAHYKIWARNLLAARGFRPLMYKKVIIQTKDERKIPSDADIEEMSKDDLKKILDKFAVRYLYKNTLPQLKDMVKSLRVDSNTKKKETESEYYDFILKRIKESNKEAENKVESVDYTKLTKTELKKILDSRKVRYLYKDTIDILISKCKGSE